MGRLTKQGIDYFPLDVQFDDKSELYLIEKEAVGLAVMITLWQIIYQNEGYFINNSSDLHLLIKRRINVNINEINDCINAMLKRGILDACLYEKYGILTSKAIQKRYFDAAKRKKEVRVIRAFIVTNLDSYTNLINVDINNIDVDINGINVGGNATKEEEEEEGKEEEDRTPPPPTPKKKTTVKKFQPPTQDEVVAYFESNGYSADAAIRAYRYYDAGNWKDAKGSQVRNWKQKMVGNWFKDENKDRPQSGSVFQNLTGRDRQNAAVLDEFLRRKEREAASGL
ncbi:MAG: DUF4373 domain-containing protein [Methanothrix soehngenii]|nr:DUF4373 domain-containing protein [Methanothrix soehngenii]